MATKLTLPEPAPVPGMFKVVLGKIGSIFKGLPTGHPERWVIGVRPLLLIVLATFVVGACFGATKLHRAAIVIAAADPPAVKSVHKAKPSGLSLFGN